MSPLLFIVRRSLANIVKGLIRKPALLVLYVLIAALSVGMIVVVFVMPSRFGKGSPELFRCIMTAVAIAVYYFSIRQGIEKGGSFFRASDVALAFTGPFRPNAVLLYGFVRQLGGMLLAMVLALYQIPNLKNNFALQPYGIWVILLAVALYALSYPIFGMIVYAATSKSSARKRAAKFLLNAAVLAVLLAFLWQLYQTRDPLAAATRTLDAAWFSWVPVVGWMRSIASAALGGIGWQFYSGLALMAATITAFLVLLYRLNLDYYEEVLEATDYREAALAAKREGMSMQFSVKARRGVRQKLFGRGAAALFSKNILELRKASFVLFFDRISAIVIIAGLAFHFIMPGEMKYRMIMVLSFAAYMLFIVQAQGRWPVELSKPWIFTLPARPSEKLLWATLSDHIKNLIDAAALFVIAGGYLGTTAQYGGLPTLLVILCVACYVFLGAVFVYADVLSRRLFGSVHSKPLLLFLKLFFVIFVISPGIGLMIALSIITHSELLAVAAFTGWSAVAAAVMFLVSSGIFKNVEAGA